MFFLGFWPTNAGNEAEGTTGLVEVTALELAAMLAVGLDGVDEREGAGAELREDERDGEEGAEDKSEASDPARILLLREYKMFN